MSPARAKRARATRATRRVIPTDVDTVEMRAGPRAVHLTNLRKPFWPELGITKGDLLQYYVDVSAALLPHLRDRAMVMKRYPNGAAGDFFFMKRAPSPRPDLDRDVLDRARVGQRDRLPDHSGPSGIALGREPRLHRPEPVVRAM